MLLVAAAGAVFALLPGRRGDAPPVRASVERDGLRYEYDALLDKETLFDVSRGGTPVDVTRLRPHDVERLRGEMLRDIGFDDLEDLRAEHRAAADWLRKLGYL